MDKATPIIRIQKNIESTTNKMRLPKEWCKDNSYSVYLEIYEDYIKIIPIKSTKKGE